MIAYHRLRDAILQVEKRPDDLAGAAITPEKLAELRESERLAELLGEIRAEAKLGTEEALPALRFADFQAFRERGTRFECERPYFRRRSRLLALTLALLIDEDDRYLALLEQTIWEICGEYSWAVPAHLPYGVSEAGEDILPPDEIVDLFAAETAHALAELLSLVGDRLHPWIAQRIRHEVERRIFKPAFGSERPFFWFSVENNWSAVCAGAVGMAALLLVEDRERLAWMQAKVVDAMESFLAGYGDDGCCLEGAGYWTYGFGYYVYWAEMLHAYTGGAIDLLQGEKIRRIAAYAGSVSLTVPACVNYSDCSPSMRLHPGLISRLRKRTGAPAPAVPYPPSFHDDHCYRWPHQVRNLLWTDESTLRGENEPGTTLFEDAGWIIDKRDTPAGLFAFSAKGGTNAESHNHNDLGHFIVHAGGETLLTDLGPGVYTQDYFGPERYKYLNTSSRGHSVPVINGQEQSDGHERRARILRSDNDGEGLHFDLELTTAYGEEAGLSSYIRHFVWQAENGRSSASLAVRDVFEFASEAAESGGSEIVEHFVSLHRPELSPGAVVWQGERGRVELNYDASVFEPSVEQLESNAHLGQMQNVYRTALTARNLPQRFVGEWTLSCTAE
ncbi:heparinase II/III-family protein [Saccharibacillus sp. O23]|uniref:heparinase II/III-family protein n=1 Tax=Saccharibacillus sp. O23 TaxID=2009338 RepID=UPI00211AD662|nr:heparinase II/III-family protein [Saccharibacillus sp. O23]